MTCLLGDAARVFAVAYWVLEEIITRKIIHLFMYKKTQAISLTDSFYISHKDLMIGLMIVNSVCASLQKDHSHTHTHL